jgi:hypothetical protein
MPTVKTLSTDQMRDQLRIFVNNAGSLRMAADLLSTDPDFLSMILSGKRTVSDAIATQLGFQKVKESKTIQVVFYIGEV